MFEDVGDELFNICICIVVCGGLLCDSCVILNG